MERQHKFGSLIVAGLAAATVMATSFAHAQDVKPRHGVAMHGEPKYGPDFKHFDYVNPNAPKGGNLRLHALRTFSTFNPYTLKGDPGAGLGNLFESLMVGPEDEAFSEYGLLAESMEMPEDRSWVAFTLRKEARWHDGKPVTLEDVIWSLETLRTKGRPFFRFYYRDVSKAEKIGERKVKFTFGKTVNLELPLIMGQLPILPKHYWAGRDFEATTLEPPVGSGPYRIKSFEPGRSITYERVRDYWGEKIPVNVGRHNVDEIRYDYYRDATVALEAFKAGDYDFRMENTSKVWRPAMTVRRSRRACTKKKTSAIRTRPACRDLFSTPAATFSKTPWYVGRWHTPLISNGPTRICSMASTRGRRATSPTPN
jgi:microcin C transport system substrate-binding protein